MFRGQRFSPSVRRSASHRTGLSLPCFEGAQASNTFVAPEEAGIKNVGIYLGSWNEWSRDPSLPVEEGLPYATGEKSGLTAAA